MLNLSFDRSSIRDPHELPDLNAVAEQTLPGTPRRAASLTLMPSLLNPEPMLTFEPTVPADVHDQLTDRVIRWNPKWAET